MPQLYTGKNILSSETMVIASVMAPQLLCFAPQIFKAYKKG
jgi:hypothetical protein